MNNQNQEGINSHEGEMGIDRMLLKQNCERLVQEAAAYYGEIKELEDPDSAFTIDLIDHKLRQLKGLESTLAYVSPEDENEDLSDMHHVFRQIKLELRLSQRKWKRLRTVAEKLRKIQTRENNLPAVTVP